MESTVLAMYKKAGNVWAKAIKLATKKAQEGTLLVDLAHDVEKCIKEEGAANAFPINLSLNEEAAHFTPQWKDTTSLKASDVLKIDIGVHIDGYICDGATTVNLDNTHAKQIEANTLALDNAIAVANYGKPIEKIGNEIERTLKSKGFDPVYNLGGHGLDKFDLHAKPSIPNHAGGSSLMLKEGAIAIEPFASTGKGNVNESPAVEIFAFEKKVPVRNPYARQLQAFGERYGALPFAERWLREESNMSEFQITLGLKELMKANAIHTFAGLKETKGTIVTQIEKSVLVLENETIILGE